MNIITVVTPCMPSILAGIALAYQQSFAGYPWYESWEIDNIVSDFEKEMRKPEAICLVAEINNRVIGFTWGYKVFSGYKLDVHLDAPDLHNKLDGEYFYLDEVAVIPGYQKKGIGRKLVTQIFDAQAHRNVLLRTKLEGPMFKLIIKMGGETIQHISRDRVIMKIST